MYHMWHVFHTCDGLGQERSDVSRRLGNQNSEHVWPIKMCAVGLHACRGSSNSNELLFLIVASPRVSKVILHQIDDWWWILSKSMGGVVQGRQSNGRSPERWSHWNRWQH